MSESNELSPAASDWDRDMHAYLVSHALREGVLLQSYLDAVNATDSKALKYVVNLLAADERRHHEIFKELAMAIRADVELSTEDPAVPRLDFHRADADVVLDVTRRLIENEEADALELKRLRKSLRSFEETTLWVLLVETMELDTAKHLSVLRFVESAAKKHRFK